MKKDKSNSATKSPLPLFDTIKTIKKISLPETISLPFAENDFNAARSFLREYDGNQATYNSYRREIERLLQWAWWIQKKSILQLNREDIQTYFAFCKKPPAAWIGLAKVPRFLEPEGQRLPNPSWRPFVTTLKKTQVKNGEVPTIKQYQLSEKAFKEIFAILSSFYNFLIQERLVEINPLLQIRQKSRYFRKQQAGSSIIRRLTELQWNTVMETAKALAKQCPEKHERTLFIMTALYAMYLRVSELVAKQQWTPKMCDFRRDHEGNWWFTTIGKGNKERKIAVSDAMLAALKRWRKHRKMLMPLPSPDDQAALIPSDRGNAPITSTNQIRNIVQYCFDQASSNLEKKGLIEEAMGLQTATVHWLRHTGISDDVKHRPREHVRDDAGHNSGATTDKYIDVELQERHRSAKKKSLVSTDPAII